jgi:hypothetical protein
VVQCNEFPRPVEDWAAGTAAESGRSVVQPQVVSIEQLVVAHRKHHLFPTAGVANDVVKVVQTVIPLANLAARLFLCAILCEIQK